MSKDLRVVVTGVTGRMGSLLVRWCATRRASSLVGGTERPGSASIGLDVGLAAKLGAAGARPPSRRSTRRSRRGADVVIDFTTPEASVAHAEACAAKKVPLVVGSTGFTAEAKASMAEAARSRFPS